MSFSLWCDFIQKDFLENEFIEIVDSGLIQGATSNPSIFAQSLKTPAYTDSIRALKGAKQKDIYESLAIVDIQRAAQILKPLWEKNNANGFVSIEIDPFLCDNASKSIDEGLRLFRHINMPNVMIKVPATYAGYEVMSALAQKGVSVNATLIFTPYQAKECASALQSGLRDSKENLQGVISVFVSRFDRMLDSTLPKNLHLQTGIINAMDCYEVIENYNEKNIRTLFASTGMKDKNRSQSYYIDNLILPHSVNTAPLDAIRAYEKSLNKSQTSLIDSKTRLDFWHNLKEYGVVYDSVAKQLLDEGLKSFKQSFEELLKSL